MGKEHAGMKFTHQKYPGKTLRVSISDGRGIYDEFCNRIGYVDDFGIARTDNTEYLCDLSSKTIGPTSRGGLVGQYLPRDAGYGNTKNTQPKPNTSKSDVGIIDLILLPWAIGDYIGKKICDAIDRKYPDEEKNKNNDNKDDFKGR